MKPSTAPPVAAALVATALAAAPLASAREPDRGMLERAVPCCATLAELPYRPLPGDRTQLVDIGEQSPLFEFDTGRSFVAAFELPAVTLPYTVQVRSYALGEVVQRARVFYPAVLLLDSNHAVLARREPEDLPVVKSGYGDATKENRWGLPLRLEWEILVDEPDMRFLVIFTTERALALRSSTTARQAIPIILPGFVTALPGKKQEFGVAHSPDGRLSVRVIP